MHSHFDLKKSHFDSRNRVPDGGDNAITAKGIKEIPSISSRLLAIPTTVLPSEGDTMVY
jgi:hypothetical protein